VWFGDAGAMKKAPQTVIIGAGLSGLAAAYRLGRNFCLLERQTVPGGLCVTVEEDGYRFDRTGHLLHLSQPAVRGLVRRLLDEPPKKIVRKSRIFSHGVYTHYPFQANTYGLPAEVVTECLTGFIEAYSKRDKDCVEAPNFEAFIHRHFGDGIARHFMIPYNTKLWGVHPREITADWCKRFVPKPTVEEVVSGALGRPRAEMGYNAAFLYPPRGIEALPLALARKVGPIEYGRAAKAVDYRRRRIWSHGEWTPYRALINTMPLKQFVQLLVKPPRRVLEAAERLRCTSLRYLDVALSRPAGTDYHWSYVPERKYPFYRVGCYSNFSDQMAPPNKSNLYVELASRGPVRLPRLLPRVIGGLKDMGIIKTADDIAFVRPRLLPQAYVVYDAHHRKSVDYLLPWLEDQGIFSAGRYARWEYAAMEDAMGQGLAAAEQAKDFIG
jgi:protoporphyrinogen oxidase